MGVPVRIKIKAVDVDGLMPEDIAEGIEFFRVDDKLIGSVFDKFREIVAQQLDRNRTTPTRIQGGLVWAGKAREDKVHKEIKGTMKTKTFYVKPYAAGSYLSTLKRTAVKERNTGGGKREQSMVIKVGGEGTNPLGKKMVNYATLIDKAFGPWTRSPDGKEQFYGYRKGKGGRFTTLRGGRTLNMNQPVDTKAAWEEALRDFGQKFREEMPRMLQQMLSVKPGLRVMTQTRRGRVEQVFRDAGGRYASNR